MMACAKVAQAIAFERDNNPVRHLLSLQIHWPA
jgi:hypothetical protein